MPPTQRISPIGTGRLPGQVKPCLFETLDNGDVKVLARFVDEDARQRFLAHAPRVNQAPVAGEKEGGDE